VDAIAGMQPKLMYSLLASWFGWVFGENQIIKSRRWRDGEILPNTALQGTLREKAAQRP
jgi:hypothetical protein